jgi:hypothetical protein
MNSLSVCVVAVMLTALVFAPISATGHEQERREKQGGQEKGHRATPVKVVNTPLPISVETPLPVTGNLSLSLPGTPAQILLQGGFSDGGINLGDTILGPRSYTIPAGFSRMLMRHVSCRAFVPAGRKVQIFLSTEFMFPGSTTPGSLIEFIPGNEISVLPFAAARQVASAEVYAFLGISTPDGPATGSTLTLNAQRDTTSGGGGVTCLVAGELFE